MRPLGMIILCLTLSTLGANGLLGAAVSFSTAGGGRASSIWRHFTGLRVRGHICCCRYLASSVLGVGCASRLDGLVLGLPRQFHTAIWHGASNTRSCGSVFCRSVGAVFHRS